MAERRNKMNLLSQDDMHIGRDFPAIPIEVVATKNFSLIAFDGKEYIDFLMGWCVGNIGWNVKEVKDAIRTFNGPTYVMPFYAYKPWVKLAELLTSIVPGNLDVCFRATGGTEAVEIALQSAMTFTKRSKFISLDGTGAYHGHSIGAMSIGDSYFRTRYSNLLTGCDKIKPPFNTENAKKAVELIKGGDIAAYISEPIVINLGVAIPELDFMKIIYDACKKYGTVFIMDEVATGFGRTGKLFATEYFDVVPDIICLAKGLSGGYGVMGATIMRKEIAEAMKFYMSSYSTFGWHPLNTVAALANLEYLISHKKEIMANVDKQSAYFSKRLKQTKFKFLKEIRIKGLAIALEFTDSQYVTDLVKHCMENGLLILDLNTTQITLFPALTIDEKTAKKGLDILENCV